jgi:hypothetical protein
MSYLMFPYTTKTEKFGHFTILSLRQTFVKCGTIWLLAKDRAQEININPKLVEPGLGCHNDITRITTN